MISLKGCRKVIWSVVVACGGGAAFCQLAAAADIIPLPVVVVAPTSIDHPTTEITPSGTFILRGSGPPKPDATQPRPERTPINYPAVLVPPAPPQRFDRNFDGSGIDRNFDRHGLTQPR